MNRQQKSEVVNKLRDGFTQSAGSFLVDYQGLTVNQMQGLRGQLRKSGASLTVAKARLIKRAVDEIEDARDLIPFCKEQIGLVLAQEDISAVAKVLKTFSDENEALKIVVGHFESRVLDAGSVVRIASLPPREVLLGQVCGTLKMPIVNTVNVLNMLILRLLFVLKQVADKK